MLTVFAATFLKKTLVFVNGARRITGIRRSLMGAATMLMTETAMAAARKSQIMQNNSVFDSIKRGLGSLLNFSELMAIIAILIAVAIAVGKTSFMPNGQPFMQNIKAPAVAAIIFSLAVLALDWFGIDTSLINSTREATGVWNPAS